MLDGARGGVYGNIDIDEVEPCPFCMLPKLTGLEGLEVLMLGVFIKLLLNIVRVAEFFMLKGRLLLGAAEGVAAVVDALLVLLVLKTL